MGLGNSFGAFQAYYEQNTLESYSESEISWIGTTQGFLLSLGGFFSGPLYDKGDIKILVYTGTVLSVVGLLSTSFAERYYSTILSFGVTVGVACGAMYVPAQAMISTHFESRASLAQGISMAGTNVGGIIYPILVRQLEDKIGFSWACRVFALMNGVMLTTACLLIKPRRKRPGEIKHFHWQTFRNWKLLLFGGCALLLNVGVDVPFFFVPTIVLYKLNLPPEVGDSLLAGLNASSLLGRIFLNWVAGKIKPINVWQFTIFAACILFFCWFLIGDLAGMIVFIIFYGFLVGGLISLIPRSLQCIFPDEADFGARLGLIEALQGIGFLVGPPIAGEILMSPASYLGVSIFFGLIYFTLFMLVGVFTWQKFDGKPSRDEEASLDDEPLSVLYRVAAREG